MNAVRPECDVFIDRRDESQSNGVAELADMLRV